MTRLSWVAHSLIGLCKPHHHNKAMINEEAVEYYSAIKMDGLYIHSKTWMDLKYVVREKKLSLKGHKQYGSIVCYFQKDKITEMESRLVVARVTQGGRTMSVTIQGSTKKGLHVMEQFCISIVLVVP